MKPLNFKIVDEAVAFVRLHKRKNEGEVPEWSKYQKLCEAHLRDAFIPKPKMPPEYYYAYLREKGLSDNEQGSAWVWRAHQLPQLKKRKAFGSFGKHPLMARCTVGAVSYRGLFGT